MRLIYERLDKQVRDIIAGMSPGETFVYHSGYLAQSRVGRIELCAMADAWYAAAARGHVFLTQKRHGENDYDYRATRAK